MTKEQPAGIELRAPYLIYLGDETEQSHAKTGIGINHWRPDLCVGQMRLPGCEIDLGLPDMTARQAYSAGARSLIWGVANVGGSVPEHWTPPLFEAVSAGMDIVAGTHSSLSGISGLADTASLAAVSLIDIRRSPDNIPVGCGVKRTGMRLLTVGTDCVVGKKFTALAIAREMKDRGLDADFRATGQTGIMIAGGGIPIDAVVSDFVSGAAEILTPDNRRKHWDIVEGQGSLFHPGYAAVTLGLLHGSQPDAFVVCHEAGRESMNKLEGFPTPELETLIEQVSIAGRVTNSKILCTGVSVNCSSLSAGERNRYLADVAECTGLPCVDPVAQGAGQLVDQLLKIFH